MSICVFSVNGQDNDALIKASSIMGNIRAANQIYTHQVRNINTLERIVTEQEKQMQQLTLAYNVCKQDWQTSDAIVRIQDLRIREKDAIIKKQSTMIRVSLGIAGIGLSYIIYREIK
jgi:hypothetical protein